MGIRKLSMFVAFFLLAFQFVYAQQPAQESANASTTAQYPFLSNSVIDGAGNLFLFRPSAFNSVYSTRVTVVTSGGTIVGPNDLSGSFLSIVAGEKAIYAINGTTTGTGSSTKSVIDLVAIKLDSTGKSILLQASIPLDGYVDVKVDPGQTSDLLYLIQTSITATKSTAPVSQTTVRVVQFNGTSFGTPITVTLP